MGRSPCCSKEGMNRGAWTALEDKILTDYIKAHGEGKWRNISKQSGLKRCGKSCRLRWLNYLRPDIKRGNITLDEEDLIIRLHKLLGNRWSLIAGRLPGRTDNEIKNYWNTNLSKKAQGKQSNQSKNEKKPVIRLPKESLLESRVIRAKASRYTGVVVTPKQHTTTPQQDNVDQCKDTEVTMAPSMDCNSVENVAIMESESDGSSLFTSKDENLSDFTVDFNMRKICLSDSILANDLTELITFDMHDFSNLMEGDGTNNGSKNQLCTFLDQSVLFSEEMLGNWKGGNNARVDMDSDYQSLASFFESADEWLGDDLDVLYPS